MDKIITNQSEEGLKILRTISKKTNEEEIEKLNLVNRLKEANQDGWTTGCGLSAIQIGVPLRMAYLNFSGKEEILINPEIVCAIGKIMWKEGCLSIPDVWIDIERKYEIEYISNGKKKKAKHVKAIAIQHEIDHMNGILIIDKEKRS